jgi:hypothetical protein
LLAEAVGVEASALPAEAREIVDECGLLPPALALSGGMAKKRGGDFRSVLERLRHADLEKIADRESVNETHVNVWHAMRASIEVLSEGERRRFAELAVFPEKESVPEAAIATLWEFAGGLNKLDTEELLINFAERSLILLAQTDGTSGRFQRSCSLHLGKDDEQARAARRLLVSLLKLKLLRSLALGEQVPRLNFSTCVPASRAIVSLNRRL